MENTKGQSDLRGKKAFRVGVLLLSTLLIVSASALVYSRVVYEKALDIGGVSGPAGLNPAPETVLILAVLASVISLSIFGFLRELSKRKNKTPNREPSPKAQYSPRMGDKK